MMISIWWLVATNYFLTGITLSICADHYHFSRDNDYGWPDRVQMILAWLPILLFSLVKEIWKKWRGRSTPKNPL